VHNEELYDQYSSPDYSGNEIMRNEMGGACGMYEGEERYRALVGKYKGK